MIRWAALATLLVAVPASAQDTCHLISENNDGGRIQYLDHQYGVRAVVGPEVPSGQIWLIRTASIHSNDGTVIESTLEVRSKVLTQNNYCCWYNGLEAFQPHTQTPKGAMTRDHVILEAGESLAARTSNLELLDLYLLFTGWRVTSACLPRLIGIEAPVASGTVVAQPLDLSGLATALNDAATALKAGSQSIP